MHRNQCNQHAVQFNRTFCYSLYGEDEIKLWGVCRVFSERRQWSLLTNQNLVDPDNGVQSECVSQQQHAGGWPLTFHIALTHNKATTKHFTYKL